jgi:septal ring factor EnvC (AmiA/AmiB activator)
MLWLAYRMEKKEATKKHADELSYWKCLCTEYEKRLREGQVKTQALLEQLIALREDCASLKRQITNRDGQITKLKKALLK